MNVPWRVSVPRCIHDDHKNHHASCPHSNELTTPSFELVCLRGDEWHYEVQPRGYRDPNDLTRLEHGILPPKNHTSRNVVWYLHTMRLLRISSYAKL